jgi:hypothetical protein
MTDYTTRAKRAIIQKNKNRGSLMIEEEFENNQVNTNFNNIHRISVSGLKLPSGSKNAETSLVSTGNDVNSTNISRLKRSDGDLLYINRSNYLGESNNSFLNMNSQQQHINNSYNPDRSIVLNESRINIVPLSHSKHPSADEKFFSKKSPSHGHVLNSGNNSSYSPFISHNHNVSINASVLNNEKNYGQADHQRNMHLHRNNREIVSSTYIGASGVRSVSSNLTPRNHFQEPESKNSQIPISNNSYQNYKNYQNNFPNFSNLNSVNSSRFIPLQNIGPKNHKINKSHDNLKNKIKQGLFSYPKSNTSVSSIKEPEEVNSMLSIPRIFSDKYQINKNNSNGNLSNRSVLLEEESSMYSMKKNDSSSSFFNKYRIGGQNLNNQSIANLEEEVDKNDKSKLVNENLNAQKEKYHTFANENKFIMSGSGSPLISKENELNKSLQANKFIYVDNYKEKPKYERESRRMLLEMVKIHSKNNNKDLHDISKELKISELIFNRMLSKGKEIKDSTKEVSKFLPNNKIDKTGTDLGQTNLNNYNKEVEKLNFNNNAKNNYDSNQKNLHKDKILPANSLTNSVEIKNNNFEINNNYYAPVNLSAENTKPFFVYNMEEDSPDKLNLIFSLIIPKILFMNIYSPNSSEFQKVPFLFQLSPSNYSHVYGIEHYNFLWCDTNSFSPVFYFNLGRVY